MRAIEISGKRAVEYDKWYDTHPAVFKSEVEAIRNALPRGNVRGIEVGLGTGRFTKALGISEGVEPSFNMRVLAQKRGIEVIDAVAERLPYKDLQLDFVLMANCIGYFHKLLPAFLEARRVLKRGGVLIVGFIEKNSVVGKRYEEEIKEGIYKEPVFYQVEKVIGELINAGFKDLTCTQTLFGDPDEIKEWQPARPGYNLGSFIIIKATAG